MGLPQLFLLWELSDQRIAEAWFEEKNTIVWTYEHAWEWISWACREPHIVRVEENTFTNPRCPITPPSRHHLYIIDFINGLCCFYRITMSIKWLLVPKSDVKQWLPTTTTTTTYSTCQLLVIIVQNWRLSQIFFHLFPIFLRFFSKSIKMLLLIVFFITKYSDSLDLW